MEKKEALFNELRESANELASYASYAEIIGAISHNRSVIRLHCDRIYEIERNIKELEELDS